MVVMIAAPLGGTLTETAVYVPRESCGAVTLPKFVILMFLDCKGEKLCVILKYALY